MIFDHSIFSLLGRLWLKINPKQRSQFRLLLVLMVIVSFAEIFTIGAVMPFLAVLSNPEHIFNMPIVQSYATFFGLDSYKTLLFFITVTFIFAALLAGFLRLILLWASTRLSYSTGAELSISLYRRTLYQSYAVHVSRNSSEIISGISNKIGIVIFTINSVLVFLSSSIILLLLLIALLIISPWVSLAAFSSFGLIYLTIVLVTRKRQFFYSGQMASESTRVIKTLQEGLGGIRDILIDSSQEYYCRIYRAADIALRDAQGKSQFIGQSPRYIIEALGMVVIASMAYFLANSDDGFSEAIPILGAFALGAQRLLPTLQQAYQSWSNIQGQQISLRDALKLLDQPLPSFVGRANPPPIPFSREILFRGLGFRYSPCTPWILRGINLSIPRGARVGFIGVTGSGKSTLLDILMGLLEPTEGVLMVDDCPISTENNGSWKPHIAHVPQTIFLADSTIAENIAFGCPRENIDFARVKKAAEQAQISKTIEEWPNQYLTAVGERGIRLSGGQRQRIGIARALYKKANVIIFDEATSALDNETEAMVMNAIENLGKDLTILIIAHRISTLKNCNLIVELEGQSIKSIVKSETAANHSV